MINLKYIWDITKAIVVALSTAGVLIWLCVYPAYYIDCYTSKINSELLQKLGYTTIVQDTSCVAYTKIGWMGCRTVLMAIGS